MYQIGKRGLFRESRCREIRWALRRANYIHAQMRSECIKHHRNVLGWREAQQVNTGNWMNFGEYYDLHLSMFWQIEALGKCRRAAAQLSAGLIWQHLQEAQYFQQRIQSQLKPPDGSNKSMKPLADELGQVITTLVAHVA